MKWFKEMAVSVLLFSFTASVFAGEIDILVNKLVEKGYLTPGEAQQIVTETKEEVKQKIAQGSYDNLPKWLQNFKLKGDARVRYQWNQKKSSLDRSRGRIRLRLGAEANVNEKVKAHVGIATGSTDDPRSTNRTFEDVFSGKSIILDYAYAEYFTTPWLNLVTGKMKNQIWTASDLLWDSDITPEGGFAKLNYTLNDKVQVFGNTGVLVLDELSGDEADPMLFMLQPGIQVKLSDTVTLKGAFSYYNFNGVKGNLLTTTTATSPATNTGLSKAGTTVSGKLTYDYDAYNPQFEITILEPLKTFGLPIPMVGFFGEYVYNPRPEKNREGYLYGLKLGEEKVDAFGKWQFKYSYRNLEKDAWLDVLPDSDFYSGSTDVKGHEASVSFGLAKNITFDLDYYQSQRILSAHKPEQIIQADLNFKF